MPRTARRRRRARQRPPAPRRRRQARDRPKNPAGHPRAHPAQTDKADLHALGVYQRDAVCREDEAGGTGADSRSDGSSWCRCSACWPRFCRGRVAVADRTDGPCTTIGDVAMLRDVPEASGLGAEPAARGRHSGRTTIRDTRPACSPSIRRAWRSGRVRVPFRTRDLEDVSAGRCPDRRLPVYRRYRG